MNNEAYIDTHKMKPKKLSERRIDDMFDVCYVGWWYVGMLVCYSVVCL